MTAQTQYVYGPAVRWIAIGAAVLVAGVLALYVGFFFWRGGLVACGNDVRERVRSPDGRREVVVFVRDCGATTSFSTQISILRAGENASDEGGNTYIAAGELRVSVQWLTPTEIVIARSVKGVTEREHVGGVSVRYIGMQRDSAREP